MKKNFTNKLKLQKETIVHLNSANLKVVRGGGTDAGCESNQDPCLTDPVTVCNCPTQPQVTCLPYC